MEKAEEAQVNMLIYTMGDELSEANSKIYDTVKSKFNSHFIKTRNVIYEQAKFNLRKQEEGESVDLFITTLYELAEQCGYADLHNEMIRDKIVVGICSEATA